MPIVVVNKIDRSDARAAEVLDEVFELFLTLEANDEQLDFPILYASGRGGYASESPDAREGTLEPLFKPIVSHVRSDERRVGKACGSTCRSRWSPSSYKQNV